MITGNFSIVPIPAAGGEAPRVPELLLFVRDREFQLHLRLATPAAHPQRTRRNQCRQRIERRASPCRRTTPKPAGRRLESAANRDFCRCRAERQFKTGCCRSDFSCERRQAPKPAAWCRWGGRSAPAGYQPFIHSFVDDRPRKQGESRPTTAPVARELVIPIQTNHSWAQRCHPRAGSGPLNLC
jgi:hypothetical protein